MSCQLVISGCQCYKCVSSMIMWAKVINQWEKLHIDDLARDCIQTWITPLEKTSWPPPPKKEKKHKPKYVIWCKACVCESISRLHFWMIIDTRWPHKEYLYPECIVYIKRYWDHVWLDQKAKPVSKSDCLLRLNFRKWIWDSRNPETSFGAEHIGSKVLNSKNQVSRSFRQFVYSVHNL